MRDDELDEECERGMAGTGLIFGMWWVYFLVPSARILQGHRDRAGIWGCGQMNQSRALPLVSR
jgi:hypothetical protein